LEDQDWEELDVLEGEMKQYSTLMLIFSLDGEIGDDRVVGVDEIDGRFREIVIQRKDSII
jgi:hypothetical protein